MEIIHWIVIAVIVMLVFTIFIMWVGIKYKLADEDGSTPLLKKFVIGLTIFIASPILIPIILVITVGWLLSTFFKLTSD